MATVLYTPLDIPVELPDVTALYNWTVANTFRDNTYAQAELGWFTHSAFACCIEPKDWRDVQLLHDVEQHYKNNYFESGKIYFHPEFAELFPTIVEAVKAMPFKELSGASIKIQYGPTFAHVDTMHSIEEPDLLEPKRITLLLTDPEHNTLWVDPDTKEEGVAINKLYCKVPSGYPIYAFNNLNCFHGSDYNPNRLRMILDTGGMLDTVKHNSLINQSIAKFKNEVIYLND
jgi:hypothetical protein